MSLLKGKTMAPLPPTKQLVTLASTKQLVMLASTKLMDLQEPNRLLAALKTTTHLVLLDFDFFKRCNNFLATDWCYFLIFRFIKI
uniref:Uncharacterized protein n=1 Tax=Arion vulgaris TaxID=1028688 RepID=A0A0B6ZSV0_9EUPU